MTALSVSFDVIRAHTIEPRRKGLTFGELHIENRYLGHRCRYPGKGFGTRPCLSNDLDAAGCLEEMTDPLPHNFMIVEEEHANRCRRVGLTGFIHVPSEQAFLTSNKGPRSLVSSAAPSGPCHVSSAADIT